MSDVMVEIAAGRYKQMPLGEALARGARRAGRKKWPSGLSEALYRLPRSEHEAKDDGRRGIGGARSFLTQRERASLSNFIGAPVESAQDARRLMKAKGLRFSEKGEKADDRVDAFLNEANGGGSDHLTSLESVDLWGDEARRKPFDAAEAYRRHEARIARGEPFRG